ncbi:MAG TPA: GNAT family N-acetyltransferase [Candidatus Aminicenantes bacterium]|nr:GNAT family N-acetyltransferase [Candidatus Aminicenantes bacterium]HRY64877.1 GNAT family N-acetyltransferase [Candidatus Aminicenantes bacterium]HRZ71790.1 GNAT family N-acetyltransferase [Candidatus Aminicenantes bacterium]
MKRIAVLDPLTDPRWDAFVDGHPFGQVYHLSAWTRILEDSFKHIRGSCYALLDETGTRIEAGCPVFRVNSRLTGNRLVSAPFTTLYDPLVSSPDQFDLLLRELLRLRQDGPFDFLEIRTFQAERFVKRDDLGESRFYKHHFLRLDSPPDVLRQGFHRTCVRQRIARAEKSQVELRIGRGESDLAVFYRLLERTRRRRALPTPPYRFIRSLWNGYAPSGRAEILLACKDGRPLAAVLLLLYKGRASVEYAASDERAHHLSPVHFVFWKAINFAYERGCRVIDFGRTSPLNTGLMDFKGRWGTETRDLVQFYCPKDAAQDSGRREESRAYRLAKRVFAVRALSPFHKALAAFCYRHMG